jgi:hypothetical protein
MEIFVVKVAPEVRKLIVYSECTATMFFTKSNVSWVTGTTVPRGLSVGCLCNLRWEPHEEVDIRLQIQGENIGVSETFFNSTTLDEAGYGDIVDVTKTLYVSDMTEPGLNYDPMKELSRQQLSLLRFLRYTVKTPETSRACRSVHRGLRCHVLNESAQENFLLHSSVMTPGISLLQERKHRFHVGDRL